VAVLAAVFIVAMVTDAWFSPVVGWDLPDQWPRAGVLPRAVFLVIMTTGLAVQATAIVLVGRWPAITVTVMLGIYVVLVLVLNSPTWLESMNLPIAVAFFFLTMELRPVRAAMTFVAMVVVFAALQWFWVTRISGEPSTYRALWMFKVFVTFFPLIVVLGILGEVWGLLTRRASLARQEAETARRRSEAIEREHERRVIQAREHERERIAQELHDVAAQHLTGLLSLADAASSVAHADPSSAIGLIGEIRAEGHYAAASLYGALSDLRSHAIGDLVRTPDIRQLTDLVKYWQAHGMHVDMQKDGDLAGLPYVVSATAYRVVHEALSNAAKYAPGACVSVALVKDTRHLAVSVVNSPSTHTASETDEVIGLGWGLAGLRSRIDLLDGGFSARQSSNGGFCVSAELPLEQRETELEEQ